MPKPDEAGVNDTVDDANKIQSAVENANAEDETDKSADEDENNEDLDEEDSKQEDDSSDDDDSEDEKSDDDDEEDEDKSEKKESAERKFKNLASDDDVVYITNLEKAYENSTAEAMRLNTELGNTQRRVNALMQAVSGDAELAERLNKAIGATDSDTGDEPSLADPFLEDAKTTWRQKSEKEVQEIIDANPELLSDPKLNSQVRHWMELLSAEEMKVNKKLMSGGEAMEAAMRVLNIKDKRTAPNVASKAKDLAAPARAQTSRKPKTSSKSVPDAAYKFGELMGVSKEAVEKYAN